MTLGYTRKEVIQLLGLRTNEFRARLAECGLDEKDGYTDDEVAILEGQSAPSTPEQASSSPLQAGGLALKEGADAAARELAIQTRVHLADRFAYYFNAPAGELQDPRLDCANARMQALITSAVPRRPSLGYLKSATAPALPQAQ